MLRLLGCCKKFQKSNEKMNRVDDKLETSGSASGVSDSAGLGSTLSVMRPSPAQSNTDVSKYAEELIKDPTVLRSANSIGKLFKGGSKNNVTTIFAKNLIESATEDLQIEIESCSSMSSGSCESGMDMMDSVLDITGLIHAEKNRIKGERSKENLGLLSQITKFKPISRETTETHQRESTHELTQRRDSKGYDSMAYLHKGYSLTRLSDLRQGKIRTVTGKTLRIKCSKTNEILRQKMIYNARQELAPPKKKKFKTIAKAVAWTVRNRLAFMKGDAKTKEQEQEEKLQKLAKIYVTNLIKTAGKKVELEERKEAIRRERRRRANRRKITKTPNYFGELEDFPDPAPWVQKFDKNHNKNNKALTYLVREIQRDIKENELGPPRPGLELPCSNLSLRHSKHSDLNLARHGDTEEEPTIFSGRKNSTIYFGGITKIEDSDTPQVREEDKLSIAAGGAPTEAALKPSEKTGKPDYLGGKSGGPGLFTANDAAPGKKSPKGGILKDDKKRGVKAPVQKDQASELSPVLTDETRTQARKSSSQDAEPVPIWTKAPKERKSWTSQDKPRDMTDPRVDAPYMLRSLTEVRADKSADEMEEPPPAPRSSECLIKGMEGLSSSTGSSGGTPEAEPVRRMPAQKQAGPSKESARVRATAVADSGAAVPYYSADAGVRTAVQKITVAVTEGLMARNPHLRILNRAVSIVDPVMQATEAMLFNPVLLGDLIHQVNHTYNTIEATTLGLTRYFVAIMSGVLTRVAGLMPLIGATEEGGLPVLPSNAPAERTDTATSTGKRLMAGRVSPPPSASGVTDQKSTDAQPRHDRQKTKLSKGRYPVREESPGIKSAVPTESMPRKSSIPCMQRDQMKPHTAAQSKKTGKPDSTEGAKKESEIKRSPPKDKKTEKSDSQEEPEGTIWKVPDRRRRSSLHPSVVKDLKNTLQHREEESQEKEKKPTLHFTSQSSSVSQKSTVTKYGKGKKKDTATQETSQALTKTALVYTPPPPPPPLPGCLPGGSEPAKAAPVVYTTQTAEVGQRAAVSSREEDGTEISTETATTATMMEAQFSAPPAPPPLPPPDYYLSGSDESDDETLKEQAPRQETATVFLPPKYLDRFQSQGFRHVEFRPSPRSSAASSVAGSEVGSVRSSRASTPAHTPRSASPVARDRKSQGVQSTALATALGDVGGAHGMVQPRRDSLAFQIHSQATKLKHSTTVRRKTSTGETEDTAETSHMVATVQAGRVPSPPPLPSFSLGLSAHPGLAMSPLSPMTLGQALHDAIGRREHAVPGHVPSSSPRRDSLAFQIHSQATKLKHSTTVRRKTSTGETEDTAEASQMVATVEANRIPTPPPLPSLGFGAHAQIAPPVALAIPSPAPTMGLLSHHSATPALPLPQFGGLGGLTGHGLSGGTAMRHTSTSAKVTQKTSVKKGDETVENVAEASQSMATTEAVNIPAPPPLPTQEQLRRASLSQALIQPNMALQLAGPSALVPQSPPTSMLSPGHGHGGGTFMRSTTASNKMTHKTKVTKGDETVENVAEASETMATMEAGHIPAPPPLPTQEQLRRASLSQALIQPHMALQLAGASLPQALPQQRVHGVGFGRVPSPPALPPMELLMSGISHGSGLVPSPPALPPMELLLSGISHGHGQVTQPPPYSMLSPGQGQGGGMFMRSTTASNKVMHKTKVTKGDETVENVAEAGQTVATMEAGHIPAPPPLPTPEQLRRASLSQALIQPHMALQLAGPQSPLTSMLSPGQGQGGGTFMRSTTASNKMTHMTKVTKGDETVENVAEVGQTVATMEAGHIPAPPPLPTPEQLRRASLSQALIQPHMALQLAGVPSPPALPPMELLMSGISHGSGLVPSPPALPPMELLLSGISHGSGRVTQPPPYSMLSPGHGQGGGTFMRSTTASNKVMQKTKVTKGDETVENVAEASETMATMEAGHIPAPPPLPTQEQLRRASLSQALIQPHMALQLAGPSALAIPQSPLSSMMSPGHGQGGGTFMRSTTASNKMTHKTKVTKGDETVENVAEASETMATMEAGHIPAPPPLPTPEQLRRASRSQALIQPHMALQLAGPSALAVPQSPPSLMSPGHGHGGGTFMRSTTASNKMMQKTKVTKGDETVENVAEASETMAIMEAGHIPAPPPLPTPEQLRRASLSQAMIQPNMPLQLAGPSLPQALPQQRVHGVGFGRVPSPPALPPMELLLSGISHGSGLVPTPPALPPMAYLMSEISYSSRRVPNPPALPPMELLMSGISGFPAQQVSQALPGPLLDLVGSGAMQPVPDPNRQYTVMTMYATQEADLSQKKTVTSRDEGHSTTEEFRVGARAAKFHTNIPDPPPLPTLKYFVPKPYAHPQVTLRHEVSQKADTLDVRREMSIELHLARKESTEFLLKLEENASKFSPKEVEEMRAEANQEIAQIDASLNQLLMSTSMRNLVEDSGSACSEDSLQPVEIVSTDDFHTAPPSIQSDSQLSIHLHRQTSEDESPTTEQHQLKLCQDTNHGESAWYQCDNNYQVVHEENTPCCLADHAQSWSYKPPRFKCGSCDETLLMKFHLETDSEGEVEEAADGQAEVPVPICHTKKHGHDHTWTYDPPKMTCKPCRVKVVLKMHLESDDEEDEDPSARPIPIHHRTLRKDPRIHARRVQSRSENKASQIPLVRKPSRTSERKYPYRQPGEKAYASPATSRKLPEPKVVVSPEMRPQPEAVSAAGTAESSPRQGRTPLKNVYTRTTDGTGSPPGSMAAKADKQSAKGSAEPAATAQKGTAKGGAKVKTQKEYSQKVWEALVGDDNERGSPKAKPTPSKDAKKPSSAPKDAGAKSSKSGPEGATKKTPPKVKGPQEAGPSGTKDTPKKTVVTSKDAPKSMASTKGASQNAKSTKTASAKSPPPSKEAKAPPKSPSGQTKESTEDKKEKSNLKASQKGVNAPKAGPSGVQTAKLTPTKIPQPVKDTPVKRKVPVMGTAALSAKRADMQSTDKASVKQTAQPPTKIPQPVKEAAVQRKVPIMGTKALSAKRADMQSTDKTSVKQAAHPPTQIPQPVKEAAVQRKVPVMGTTAHSRREEDMQTTDAHATHTPTKIPQPVKERKVPVMGTTALSARRENMQTADAHATHTPTKIPQPIQVTAVARKTPVMGKNALSARRTEESKGVQTRPASIKTAQPAKVSADRPRTPLKESATKTAGPSSTQTTPASVKTAGQSSAQTTDKPAEPMLSLGSGIKKYTDEERAKLDAEVDGYWSRRFSKDREKPWWNIEDPEERERARLRQDRSKTDLRRTGSSNGASGVARGPGIHRQRQMKYDVDRSPVMLPGHYGAATGVSRASRPDVGLVPKKLEMDFFDSSEDSEDDIDLDKPISKEDLHNDDYWMAMEKKAYAMVKASMEQLETDRSEDEKQARKAVQTEKKPSKFSRMFQSRKEKEKKIDREARVIAIRGQGAKKQDTFEHKSDPPNEKPVYGPPLPPKMQTEMEREKEKKKGLTRYGHKGVPTLAAMKAKEKSKEEEEPSTSQKRGGRLTPNKLVGKIKGGFTRVKDSIRSKLSGEDSSESSE